MQSPRCKGQDGEGIAENRSYACSGGGTEVGPAQRPRPKDHKATWPQVTRESAVTTLISARLPSANDPYRENKKRDKSGAALAGGDGRVRDPLLAPHPVSDTHTQLSTPSTKRVGAGAELYLLNKRISKPLSILCFLLFIIPPKCTHSQTQMDNLSPRTLSAVPRTNGHLLPPPY